MSGVDRRCSACLRSRAAAETGAEKYEGFCPPSRGERVAGSAEFRFSETPAADLEGTRQIIAAGRLRHLFFFGSDLRWQLPAQTPAADGPPNRWRAFSFPCRHFTVSQVTESVRVSSTRQINGRRGESLLRKRSGGFESRLSVPSKVNGVWPQSLVFWQAESFAVMAFEQVKLAPTCFCKMPNRHDNPVVIRYRPQALIESPMGVFGQCDSVTRGVVPAVTEFVNMGGVNDAARRDRGQAVGA